MKWHVLIFGLVLLVLFLSGCPEEGDSGQQPVGDTSEDDIESLKLQAQQIILTNAEIMALAGINDESLVESEEMTCSGSILNCKQDFILDNHNSELLNDLDAFKVSFSIVFTPDEEKTDELVTELPMSSGYPYNKIQQIGDSETYIISAHREYSPMEDNINRCVQMIYFRKGKIMVNQIIVFKTQECHDEVSIKVANKLVEKIG